MLIGLVGQKRSGKDTVANHLYRGYGFSGYAFADKLKAVATDLWDLSHEQVHGTEAQKEAIDPRWGVSPRHLMQVLGTEIARHAHTDTWIRWLHRNHLKHALSIGANCVVTDVRFQNEAAYIREHGGKIVRIYRPETDDRGDNHSSETELAKIHPDFILMNDGSLRFLEDRVDGMVRVFSRGSA